MGTIFFYPCLLGRLIIPRNWMARNIECDLSWWDMGGQHHGPCPGAKGRAPPSPPYYQTVSSINCNTDNVGLRCHLLALINAIVCDEWMS